ncbi:MAG TPA: uracil-DNA glycosylase family protein [Polyangiaceae bacterium]|nr:uracil-DNA glycosylase family protein [Polyangiaceae bacterium]
MQGPPVLGRPVRSRILLVGQAPGDREPVLGRPFAWTAGKQLFKWFATIGLDEEQFRSRVYMAAVCRCFPGKNPSGGDRVPAPQEIENCKPWLDAELMMLSPRLVIPVGRVAIEQLLSAGPARAGLLTAYVGTQQRIRRANRTFDVIPLPHPSGASTWPRTEPGKTLTAAALRLIADHSAWRKVLASPERTGGELGP